MVKASSVAVNKKKKVLKQLDACSTFESQVQLFRSLYLEGLSSDQQAQIKVSLNLDHPVMGSFTTCMFSLAPQDFSQVLADEKGTASYHTPDDESPDDKYTRSEEDQDEKADTLLKRSASLYPTSN